MMTLAEVSIKEVTAESTLTARAAGALQRGQADAKYHQILY